MGTDNGDSKYIKELKTPEEWDKLISVENPIIAEFYAKYLIGVFNIL